MSSKLVAWLNLAWHFAKHVTTRLWLRPFRAGRDLARFNRTVTTEGYRALHAGARAEFASYMNCVHCGLCALACPPLVNQPASAWQEAWTFVGGASRSLDRASLVARDITMCADEPAAQAVCPMGVPINHMANTIRSLAE